MIIDYRARSESALNARGTKWTGRAVPAALRGRGSAASPPRSAAAGAGRSRGASRGLKAPRARPVPARGTPRSCSALPSPAPAVSSRPGPAAKRPSRPAAARPCRRCSGWEHPGCRDGPDVCKRVCTNTHTRVQRASAGCKRHVFRTMSSRTCLAALTTRVYLEIHYLFHGKFY